MKEMRRKDRRLSDAEALELLKNGEYGILSTVGEDDVPYGVPVSYAVSGDTIYFHGAEDGGLKTQNIKNNSKVCFTVVGKTEVLQAKFSTKYESAIIFGTAYEIKNDKAYALSLLIKKYSPDFLDSGAEYIESAKNNTAVYAIKIDSLTGKARK